MGKTALIISSTSATGGKKLQKTLTDINPAATNAQLKSFSQKLTSLTTNNYGETNRVDKINCDTDDSATSKAFREITITGAAKGATATLTVNISEGETLQPAVFYYNNGSATVLTTTATTSDAATVAKFTITVPNTSGLICAGLAAKTDFYSDFVLCEVS